MFTERTRSKALRFCLCVVVAGVFGAGCSGDAPGVTGPEAPGGSAPVFRSTPVTTADHNRPYSYQVSVDDPDGDDVTVTAPQLPSWMSFDSETGALSGRAGWNNISTFDVTLQANDGAQTARQNFTVTVQRGEIVCDQDFGDPATSAYILPFPVGKTYGIIQSYCPPNPAWGHHNWFAYDFDTAIGDTVTASRSGGVIAVREDNPNGTDCSGGKENFVFILHDDGTVMQYVHLTTDGALVQVNDRVAQGQPIGLSGNSGCSAGRHLHVALFRNRTNYERHSTLPFNYRNTSGSLDANRGLIQGARYTAEPY